MTRDEMVYVLSPIVEFGADGTPILPDIILARRNGEKIGVLQNVSGFSHAPSMNAIDEISFDVNKYINGEECALWDELTDLKYVYIPQYDDWFDITVDISEDSETVKSVYGVHAQESELSQRLLFDVEINTEDDIARDDYVVTKFYNEDNPKGSLLHRILADKCQDYTIRHVDYTLMDIQRTFSFNGKSVKDAFDEVADEVECLFVYGESSDDDGKIHRTISVYDLLEYCHDCQTRGNYIDQCTKCGSTNIRPSYGEDTNIFVSCENIAKSITLKSNADNVKNCFRLEAGDDVMTAVVRSINPSGSQYLWHFSDDMYAEMSTRLADRLIEYNTLYNTYETSYVMSAVPQNLIDRYNELYEKYHTYGKNLAQIESPIEGTRQLTNAAYQARYMYDFLRLTMMPGSTEVEDTTAEEQLIKLNVSNLSPMGIGPDKKLEYLSVSTADSAIVNYAKIFVDTSRYRITISGSSYENPYWHGVITVSSYTNDEDTASTDPLTIKFNTADETYLRQSIEKTMDKMKASKMDIVSLFKKNDNQFASDLQLFSLSNLQLFQSVCDACLDILIEHGVGESDSDLYEQIYLPYYRKSGLIEAELKTREQELSYLLAKTDDSPWGLIDYIEKQQLAVRATLDMYEYLGADLWQELMAFRRDDTYQNQNFISDGLTDSQLIENAIQFYNVALREVEKSSTLQNALSGNLQDFLIMPEFAPLMDQFKVGNKIHVGINDKVYKLRFISYEIDYNNITKLSIDFSDIIKGGDFMSDTRSILSQAKSIATTYNATTRQAEKGRNASNQINNFVYSGLDLTSTKIVNSADNQNMRFDNNGLLMRRKDDFGEEYSLEQVKIINQGLYYTMDNWRSVSTGIGHFKYLDPQTGQEMDGYGVIANTVVGNLILGNDLKIFNANGSMVLDDNGSIFTILDDADNSGLFKIRRQNPDGSYTDLIYVDGNGKLVIRGTEIEISSGVDLPSYIDDVVARTGSTLVINLSNENIAISTDHDGNYGSYINAQTQCQVMSGRTDITDTVPITVSASSGVIGVWDSVNHIYKVNNLTADEGTVTFVATYNNIEAVKIFRVVKVKDGESTISVEIESTNGNLFKNGSISTQLICRVYRGTDDITDTVTAFDWYRALPDGTRDQTWNRLGAGNIINITSADVISRATFKCNVTI